MINRKTYISRTIRYKVLARQQWYCNICGCKLKYSNHNPFPGEVAHIDHIYPFSKRESYPGKDINESSNLEALCPDCNFKKQSKGGF